MEAQAVRLEPMSDATYSAWRDRSVRGYAAEHVAAGNWPEEDAVERSEREFQQYLPAGVATPGHFLWSVRSGGGEDVGILWVATDRRPGQAFIFDIEILPERRGHGFGTAALEALEDWARANGISSIGLHVFGHNTGAWQLYKRLGYVETDVQMQKTL